ncbi:hypothetical protein ZEAMMB73_Zm00001d024670 [Zea mays]|uniref:Uncharacterized protein n=1 Tax=Zea mays TaxID=4577 RepID=A0A1D6J0X2_MAIZE|nr:hypothetical protein ZEAMMB73_Zm00001d024670 [Zea mays]
MCFAMVRKTSYRMGARAFLVDTLHVTLH